MKKPIIGLARGALELRPYEAEWAARFEDERRALLACAPSMILAVEHVGSTSIPGLAAKPVIDMQASVPTLDRATKLANLLEPLGYTFMPDRVYEHHIFMPKGPEDCRTHYLHITEAGSAESEVRLRFRDALRADAALRDEYEALKRRLMAAHRDDRPGYTASKATFITRVLREHP